MNCRRFAALTIVLALAGTVAVAADFDPNDGWFFLGLTAVLLAAMGGVCWYFAGKRANLDDAYELGYQAGFRQGERVRPKVIRLEHEREHGQRQSPTRD